MLVTLFTINVHTVSRLVLEPFINLTRIMNHRGHRKHISRRYLIIEKQIAWNFV